MITNGKDRLAAALGESYPRVWRGLGLESKTGRNLPDIQDKKRPGADASPTGPYPRQRYIFGSRVSADRVSGTGYQVRVIRFGCGYGPEPVPVAEHLNLRPDGRDLGPENEFEATLS
jgi:hypothetical protein